MANKQAVSISLDTDLTQYLEQRGALEERSRSDITAESLRRDRLQWLADQMQEGFAAQDDEDVALAEGDMRDYKKIVTRDE